MNTLLELGRQAVVRNLACLVAGGHAVLVHGYQRTTFDLDLVISRADKDQWLLFMRDIGYQFFHESPTFVQFTPPTAEDTPVDLLLTSAETFAKMVADAVPVGLPGVDLRAVSLQHLIALKCHAIRHGHPGRIVKDVDDVIRLIQLNRVDVTKAEWRDLILKYATAELYEKLRGVCQKEP